MLTDTGMLWFGCGLLAAASADDPVAIANAVPWWEDRDRCSGA